MRLFLTRQKHQPEPLPRRSPGLIMPKPSRSQLQKVALETMEIVKAGGYHHGGAWVPISTEPSASESRIYETRKLPHPTYKTTNVLIENETTVASALRNATKGPTVCLNFASAKRPGGGFLSGASAQEETIARSSTLFAALSAVPEFYDQSEDTGGLYTDQVVVSPSVTFFRDDDGNLIQNPKEAHILTCAAPNLKWRVPFGKHEYMERLETRISGILEAATHFAPKTLILGAWGCGVFANHPDNISKAFARVIPRFEGHYEKIVFAIPSESADSYCVSAFRRALLKSS